MLDPQLELILIGVGKGVVYGAFAGGMGYVKNETWETFDPYKFLRTIIIGATLGAVVSYRNGDLSDVAGDIGTALGVPGPAVETAIMTAIVAFADNVVKIVARRTDLGLLYTKIKRLFGNK